MTPQTDKQIITRHILPDTSRSKGDQAMKFDQLSLKIMQQMTQGD